jgi:hypothetical protein
MAPVSNLRPNNSERPRFLRMELIDDCYRAERLKYPVGAGILRYNDDTSTQH